MYTMPTSLSVAGPVIAVTGSPYSRRISSAAPQQATGSGAAITYAAPTSVSSRSRRMSCTPYSPRMPSPSSATITSGLAWASRLKIPLAVVTVTPACVLAMPTSLKVRAATAPASCIERASRMSDTPVSLAAATRSPERTSPRTSSVAATVLPEFMQVPATYTTGIALSSRSAGGTARSLMWAGRPTRSPNSGKVKIAPSTSALKGGPISGFTEVHRPRIPPRLSTSIVSPGAIAGGTTPA